MTTAAAQFDDNKQAGPRKGKRMRPKYHSVDELSKKVDNNQDKSVTL